MTERNLTALKTLVISMGVVLVVGFLVVGIAIGVNMKADGLLPMAHKGALPAQCPGGAVDLKGRGQIVDTAVEGSTIRFAIAKPSGELEMIHIDICTGKELSSLRITTDLPEAPHDLSALPPQSSVIPEATPAPSEVPSPSAE